MLLPPDLALELAGVALADPEKELVREPNDELSIGSERPPDDGIVLVEGSAVVKKARFGRLSAIGQVADPSTSS